MSASSWPYRRRARCEHDRVLEREASRLHRERGAGVAHCRLTLRLAPEAPFATRRS